MSRKIGAIVSAAITLLVFTILPLYAPSFIPSEVKDFVSSAGIDLDDFFNQMAILGLVTALITLARGFFEKSSPIYLTASIASSSMMFIFTLLTLGLGDIRSLGINKITIEVEGIVNTIVMDMRFFIQLAAVSVGLSVIHSFMEFIDARKEKAPPPQRVEEPILVASESDLIS